MDELKKLADETQDYFSAIKQAESESLFEQVKRDLDQRNLIGWYQHQKELTADASLNWLQEHYEELLDACIYIKGEILRRRNS